MALGDKISDRVVEEREAKKGRGFVSPPLRLDGCRLGCLDDAI